MGCGCCTAKDRAATAGCVARNMALSAANRRTSWLLATVCACFRRIGSIEVIDCFGTMSKLLDFTSAPVCEADLRCRLSESLGWCTECRIKVLECCSWWGCLWCIPDRSAWPGG